MVNDRAVSDRMVSDRMVSGESLASEGQRPSGIEDMNKENVGISLECWSFLEIGK